MTDDLHKAFARPAAASLVTLQTKGPVCFAKILTPTVASVESPVLGDTLRAVLADNDSLKYLVLDVEDVTMLSSAALGMLVSTHTTALNRGVKVILVGVAPSILDMLIVTKLTTVLTICKTSSQLEQALRG